MPAPHFLESLHLILTSLRQGDLSPRLRPNDDPQCNQIATTLNDTLDHLARITREINRIHREIGLLGQLGPTALVPDAAGDWKLLLDGTNALAHSLTDQLRHFQFVATAIENHQPHPPAPPASIPCHGELRALRDTLNRILDQSTLQPAL